jgi:hypothetical protein
LVLFLLLCFALVLRWDLLFVCREGKLMARPKG